MSRVPTFRFVVLLLGLALLVVSAAEVLAVLDKDSRDPVAGAYLIKSGPEYFVWWRNRDSRTYRAFRFDRLDDARAHLSQLGLVPGRAKQADYRLDRLWIRSGAHPILFWKFRGNTFRFQMTFDRPQDARFFLNAFESGTYTGSPFGHALLFVPRS